MASTWSCWLPCACGPADALGGRMFSVGPALALPAIGRTLEDAPGRRLRRVVLDLGVDPAPGASSAADPATARLRVLDDRRFDTVLGADCRPRSIRGAIDLTTFLGAVYSGERSR